MYTMFSLVPFDIPYHLYIKLQEESVPLKC